MKNNTFKLTGYVATLTALLLQACSVQETQKENKSADIASINENKHADMEQRIKALLAKMTLEQKIGQMLQPEIRSITPAEVEKYHIGSILNGGGAFPNNDKYASVQDWVALADAFYQASMSNKPGRTPIPIIWGTDAVHGHNNVIGATYFPHNIGLGAANNPALIEKIAQATAVEVAATGIDWTFAPTLAVVRDDRWGRTYESYSEDPAIVKTYAQSMVNGLQGHKNSAFGASNIVATAKHFVGDGGTQFGDDQGDTQLTEEELFKLHAQGYYSALDANVQTVMVSYSSFNGEKMHGQKHLITDVLKHDMGFDGIVVSDWNGIGQVKGCTNDNCAAAINAGIDLFMVPDLWKTWIDNTLAQVKQGVVPMSRIDDAVTRILRVKMRAGLFDKGAPSTRALAGKADLVGKKAHRDIAQQAVRESLVLLKNNHNLLPLDRQLNVLVAGDGADNIAMQNGGWTISWQGTGNTNKDFPGATSIYQGIQQTVTAAGGSATLSVDGTFEQKPDVAIVVVGEEPYTEYLGDIQNLRSLEFQQHNKKALALLTKLKQQNIPTITVLMSGRVLWVNKELNASDAFVAAWLPGTEGQGIADVLFKNANNQINYDFTGRLSFSWPADACQSTVNIGDETYQPLFEYGYGLSYQDKINTPELPENSAYPYGCQLTAQQLNKSAKQLSLALNKHNWQLYIDEKSGKTNQVTPSLNELHGIKVTPLNDNNNAVQVTFAQEQTATLALRQQPHKALNLLPHLKDNSAITWQVRVDKPIESDIKAKIDCGAPCSGEVDISAALKAKPLGQWQTLSIDLACYLPGTDLRKVASPLVLSSSGALNISFAGGNLVPNSAKNADIQCSK
ncbi:glycoside hydrolase family 3 N-terminal domain-containing protein [Thalassotalea agariperforans]